ncbi:hypothetical protein DRE_03945 [Drechslerella stenobrocha 248]|uniref:Uncharacterized protein n=1 Tax=Drechslerella stenobrocha 248 TaxID=1043628 RepID=W7IC76_9PEZI|nr:hypothetical protein DRE_03945 [Drechslerella stenobrocha 248]
MCLIGTTERRVEYPVARRVSYIPPRQETVIVERPRSSYHTHRSTSRSRSRHNSKASVVYATPRGSYVSTRREVVPIVVERTHR